MNQLHVSINNLTVLILISSVQCYVKAKVPIRLSCSSAVLLTGEKKSGYWKRCIHWNGFIICKWYEILGVKICAVSCSALKLESFGCFYECSALLWKSRGRELKDWKNAKWISQISRFSLDLSVTCVCKCSSVMTNVQLQFFISVPYVSVNE